MTPYRAASIGHTIARIILIGAVLLGFCVLWALGASMAHASWLPDPSDRINDIGSEFGSPPPPAVVEVLEAEAPVALQRKAPVAKQKVKVAKPLPKKKLPAARAVPRTPTPKARPLEAPMPSADPAHCKGGLLPDGSYLTELAARTACKPAPKVEAPVAPPVVEAPVKRKAHFWSCDPNVKHHFFKFCDTK